MSLVCSAHSQKDPLVNILPMIKEGVRICCFSDSDSGEVPLSPAEKAVPSDAGSWYVN